MPSGPTPCRPTAPSSREITFERARPLDHSDPVRPPERHSEGPESHGQRSRRRGGRRRSCSAPAAPGAVRRRAATAAASLELADLRRQPGEPSLLAGRPDHEGQLQPARDRLAAEDRLPGPAPRHAVFGHAAARRPRAVHDGRHAARRRRARRRHRRDALDAQRGRGRARQNAPRHGAGRGVAYWASAERHRSARHLRHARLPHEGARREDRQPRFRRSAATASSI